MCMQTRPHDGLLTGLKSTPNPSEVAIESLSLKKHPIMAKGAHQGLYIIITYTKLMTQASLGAPPPRRYHSSLHGRVVTASDRDRSSQQAVKRLPQPETETEKEAL